MKGFVVVTQQLPNKVKPIPTESNNAALVQSVLNRTVKEKNSTVYITNLVKESTKKNNKKPKSIYVEKLPSRNWVVSTGRIDITDLQFDIGDIFVDAQTTKVFVYAKDSIDSQSGVSFQFVELGYYSDFCEATEYFESDTEPTDAVFGDRWLNTSTGTIYTLVKNAANQDVWAQIGQTSGVCEGSDIFYSQNDPSDTVSVIAGSRWYDVRTGAFYTYSSPTSENWVEFR